MRHSNVCQQCPLLPERFASTLSSQGVSSGTMVPVGTAPPLLFRTISIACSNTSAAFSSSTVPDLGNLSRRRRALGDAARPRSSCCVVLKARSTLSLAVNNSFWDKIPAVKEAILSHASISLHMHAQPTHRHMSAVDLSH